MFNVLFLYVLLHDGLNYFAYYDLASVFA